MAFSIKPKEHWKELREEFFKEIYGAVGLEYRILFAKPGYTPHYVEHVIDPVDKREKLVMFDPHTRRSAIIYDPVKKEIEWEFVVPGTARPNPHAGGMLLEDVPGFGEAGDIYTVDRDNNIIVIDRDTMAIKFSKMPTNWNVQWLHVVKKGIDNSLIVTDYDANVTAKLSIPDLSVAWMLTGIFRPSKVSVIEGAGLTPDPSFGGHYLVVSNHTSEGDPYGGVLELNDLDGAIVWSNPSPYPKGRGTWLTAPHSAFRLGRVENYGNVTVVGGEGGGGIVAISYTGEPVWGISSPGLRRSDGMLQHYFNPYNLAEVTHVFPTLNGRIGFSAWCGFNSAIVGEIIRLPQKQTVAYVLAYDQQTTDSWTYLEPIVADGWDEIQIVIKNTGTKSLDFQVIGYVIPAVDLYSYPSIGRITAVSPTSLPGGNDAVVDLTRPFSFIQVAVKSTTAGSPTIFYIYVTKRRS